MRRAVLTILAASASLAACGDANTSQADGAESAANGAPNAAKSTGVVGSPDPTSTLISPATSGATATSAATTRAVDSNPPGDECGASQVAAFVAQEATPAVRARLAAKVGHSRIRWIGPDTVVTMDYSAARLNVTLDKADVITGGKCG